MNGNRPQSAAKCVSDLSSLTFRRLLGTYAKLKHERVIHKANFKLETTRRLCHRDLLAFVYYLDNRKLPSALTRKLFAVHHLTGYVSPLASESPRLTLMAQSLLQFGMLNRGSDGTPMRSKAISHIEQGEQRQ